MSDADIDDEDIYVLGHRVFNTSAFCVKIDNERPPACD